MSTYIVIEISEKDNASDIMNILLKRTTARIVVTTDIIQYAQEREQLKEQKEAKKEDSSKRARRSRGSVEPLEPPPKREVHESESKDIVEIEPPVRVDFDAIVPKTEEPTPLTEQEQYAVQPLPFPNYYQPDTPLDPAPLLSHSWNEHQVAPSKRGRPRGEEVRFMSKSAEIFSCAVCGAQVRATATDFYKRSNHAITHTNLRRYICPSEECGIKSRHRSNMSAHVSKHHPDKRRSAIHSCMSPTEEEELRQMVLKCFPEFGVNEVSSRSRRTIRYAYEDDDVLVDGA